MREGAGNENMQGAQEKNRGMPRDLFVFVISITWSTCEWIENDSE